MKILLAVAFVGILGALLSAGVFMVRDGRDGKPKTGNMMRALALRVALSVLLFITLRLMKGHFTPQRHFGFEGAAWYWHFVDVVWLGLYIVVYWA